MDKLLKLPEEDLAKRLQDANWNLLSTGNFFFTTDATQVLSKGESAREAKLHIRHYSPQKPELVQASVFFLHGIHAHVNSRPFCEFLKALAAKGFAVFTLDLPGHGYSEGEPALLPSTQAVFNILEDFIRLVMGGVGRDATAAEKNLGATPAMLTRVRGRPYFIMGESMGGLFALAMSFQVVEREPPRPEDETPTKAMGGGFRGAVLVCPALKLELPPAPVTWLLRNVVAASWPRRTVPAFLSSTAALKPEDIFTDPLHQEMTIVDSLPMPEYGWKGTPGALAWHHGIRWATADAILTLTEKVEEMYARSSFPFLIMHSPEDAVCLFQGSEHLIEVSPSTDKKLVATPGGRHALCMNVPERVVAESSAWMMERL